MRKLLPGALVFTFAALALPAQTPVAEKIAAYFRGWYAYVPGSEVSARLTKDVALPGLESYMVERRSSSKSHQESNLALYDPAAGEVFVGDVLNDPERAAADRPFEPGRDLPNIEASLGEVFGLPVKVQFAGGPRGVLLPMTVSIPLEKSRETFATRSGFISRNGATLCLGEFHPLGGGSQAFRERLLSQSEGVRSGPGRFTVTEFLDFQCDRCRVRTPDVRRAVEEKGGAVEVRFLPLVKMHEWAFATAESAAALANIRPELYRRYEEAAFGRAEGMSAAAARELAADIAEAAGAREAFAAELSSGRARARVARDVSLAMRLGILSTPSFIYRGVFLASEKGVLETYLWESLPAQSRRTPTRTP